MATGPSERTWVTVTWEQLDQKPIHLRNQLLTSSAKLVLEANEQRLAERLKKAHKGKKSRAQPAAGGASGSSGTCSHCRVFRAPASELAEHELGCSGSETAARSSGLPRSPGAPPSASPHGALRGQQFNFIKGGPYGLKEQRKHLDPQQIKAALEGDLGDVVIGEILDPNDPGQPVYGLFVGKETPAWTVLGEYAGRVLLNSVHEQRIHEDPDAWWRYLYTFELPEKVGGTGPDANLLFCNPGDPADKFIVDASKYRNELAYMNSPYCPLPGPDGVVAPPDPRRQTNACFFSVWHAGRPHVLVCTTRHLQQYDELLVEYGEEYWHSFESLKMMQLSKHFLHSTELRETARGPALPNGAVIDLTGSDDEAEGVEAAPTPRPASAAGSGGAAATPPGDSGSGAPKVKVEDDDDDVLLVSMTMGPPPPRRGIGRPLRASTLRKRAGAERRPVETSGGASGVLANVPPPPEPKPLRGTPRRGGGAATTSPRTAAAAAAGPSQPLHMGHSASPGRLLPPLLPEPDAAVKAALDALKARLDTLDNTKAQISACMMSLLRAPDKAVAHAAVKAIVSRMENEALTRRVTLLFLLDSIAQNAAMARDGDEAAPSAGTFLAPPEAAVYLTELGKFLPQIVEYAAPSGDGTDERECRSQLLKVLTLWEKRRVLESSTLSAARNLVKSPWGAADDIAAGDVAAGHGGGGAGQMPFQWAFEEEEEEAAEAPAEDAGTEGAEGGAEGAAAEGAPTSPAALTAAGLDLGIESGPGGSSFALSRLRSLNPAQLKDAVQTALNGLIGIGCDAAVLEAALGEVMHDVCEGVEGDMMADVMADAVGAMGGSSSGVATSPQHAGRSSAKRRRL